MFGSMLKDTHYVDIYRKFLIPLKCLLSIPDGLEEERAKHILKFLYTEGFVEHKHKNYLLSHLLFSMIINLA